MGRVWPSSFSFNMLEARMLFLLVAVIGMVRSQTMPPGSASFGPNIQWLDPNMNETDKNQLNLDIMRHLPGAYNTDVANHITCMCNKASDSASFLEESDPLYHVRKDMDAIMVPHALTTQVASEELERRSATNMKKKRESIRESKSCRHARLHEKKALDSVCHLKIVTDVMCVRRVNAEKDVRASKAFSGSQLKVLGTNGSMASYFITVKSVQHVSSNDGKYFNFDPKEMYHLSGHKLWQKRMVVKNLRSGFVGTVTMWPAPGVPSNTDAEGRASGRRDVNAQAGDWITGDVLQVYAEYKLPADSVCHPGDNFACESDSCMPTQLINATATSPTGYLCVKANRRPAPLNSICSNPYHPKWYPDGDASHKSSCTSEFCDCWSPLLTHPTAKPMCKCREKKTAGKPCRSGKNGECLTGHCVCKRYLNVHQIACQCTDPDYQPTGGSSLESSTFGSTGDSTTSLSKASDSSSTGGSATGSGGAPNASSTAGFQPDQCA